MNIRKKDINVSQTVNAATAATLFTYRVPAKGVIRLTHFSNYLSIVGAWGDVTFSIRRNGVGIFPYDELLDQIGISSRPREIEPIIVNGGDMLSITVDNQHIANVDCGIALRYEEIER